MNYLKGVITVRTNLWRRGQVGRSLSIVVNTNTAVTSINKSSDDVIFRQQFVLIIFVVLCFYYHTSLKKSIKSKTEKAKMETTVLYTFSCMLMYFFSFDAFAELEILFNLF